MKAATKIHVKGKYCAGPNCDCKFWKSRGYSPKPWKIEKDKIKNDVGDFKNVFRIVDRMGDFVADCGYSKKDSSHIIKCVNAYEILIDACGEAMAYLRDIDNDTEQLKSVYSTLANSIAHATN